MSELKGLFDMACFVVLFAVMMATIDNPGPFSRLAIWSLSGAFLFSGIYGLTRHPAPMWVAGAFAFVFACVFLYMGWVIVRVWL